MNAYVRVYIRAYCCTTEKIKRAREKKNGREKTTERERERERERKRNREREREREKQNEKAAMAREQDGNAVREKDTICYRQ